MHIIPSLALLLKSEEVIDRYFAAQAMASLVCNRSKGINSGAVSGLITLIGYLESDMPNLVTLTEEFSLVQNHGQVVSEHLSEIEDELIQYEASLSSLNQLIAVLRLGSKNARFSAVRALHQIFYAHNAIDSELARQAVQPLVDMLSSASESEQEAALVALIKLTSGNASKAALMTDVEGNPLESIYKILASASSLELKRNAAQLCFVLFGNTRFRADPIASECIQPLISLMQSDASTTVESGVCAFERLLHDERQVELAVAYDIVDLLVGLVSGRNHQLIDASICALIKLGKDRTPLKSDMVKAGVIDKCLEGTPSCFRFIVFLNRRVVPDFDK
ncbi:hypothetical protein V6N12_044369 [Hibiscus sabdariffa]|uniref:ARM repeat superfamily protein n=1 Tax=Hibiscus sabdariffa TaxID=183260 RepID=A0ABR2DH19_9ROSI